jgi:4-amino-4-deoxy-L-arabinose transferase-like glycosyltransferase
MRFPKKPGPLFLLTFFFVAVTGVWLILNRSPPQWDDAWYLTNSLILFDALEGGLPAYARAYLSVLRLKPPLITVLPTPIYFLFGREPKLAYLVNIAAMPLLFVTLYLIARRVGNRTTGLLAVFVAATMPLLYGLSHWFLVDYLLTALVCLTVCLVFVALERPDTSTFFLLGITFGLGMLLKISYPVYVFLPVLYMLIRLWRTSRLTWTSLLALLAPGLVLALPWYAVNYRAAIARGFYSGFSAEVQQAGSGTGPVFSIQAVSAYLLSLVNSGASAYYTFLAIVLLPFQPKNGPLILTLWALPFALFLFAPNKDLRLVAPILPVLSLYIASALVKATRGKGTLIAMLLVFPLLAFLCNSFGLGQLAVGPVIFAARELHFAGVYKRQRWSHRQILEHIVRSARIVNGVKPLVMLATDTAEFNINNLELAARQYRLPLNIASSAYETDPSALLARLGSASFVVYKDGGTPEPGGFNRLQKVLLQDVETGEGFREIPFGLPLPDGGVTRIFQNVSPPGLLSEWAFSRARPRSPAIENMQCDFGGQILLTGLGVEHTSSTLVLRLRWRCLKPPMRNYFAFVHILGPDQQPVGHLDHRLMDENPPALSWRPGDEALETMVASLTALQATGAYQIRVGLYYRPTGERLPVKILSSPRGFSTTDNESALLTPVTH